MRNPGLEFGEQLDVLGGDVDAVGGHGALRKDAQVGEVGDGRSAVNLARELRPDVVIMDIKFEGEEYDGSTGYLTESAVIAMAEAAGFVLLDKSEINANPRDTKNHPSGVWSLPPVLRLPDDKKDMEPVLKAIGESDRMTLKFRKPAN